MGYELRRWLADRLPAGLSSGERLVALEIADRAREDTRRAYGTDLLDIVVRRTGLADQKQLGKVLGKLAANGVELRVPVRKDGQVVTDSRGRALYACKGHALEFRIPTNAECPALLLLPQEGDLQSSPEQGTNEPKAPPSGAQSSPARGTKLPPAGDPIPQSPQHLSSLVPRDSPDPTSGSQPQDERETNQQDGPDQILAAYTQALARPALRSTAERIRRDAAQLLADGLPAWWLADRARELAEKGWSDLIKHCERSTVPVEAQRPADVDKPCGAHDQFNRVIRDPTTGDLIPCPDCHPAEVARRRRQGAA